VVAVSLYTVTAERSGKWWVLQADEAPGAISQVARLDQAPQIIEAIAFVTGELESDIEIDVRPVLPRNIQERIEAARTLREQAAEANGRSAQEARAAAKALQHDLSLTVRDVGIVLDVSFQRAHQLVSS
jgi:predicted nucleic acid-binding protein